MIRYFQEKVKSLIGVSPALFYGRGVFNYSFGFLPHRKPINTVRKYNNDFRNVSFWSLKIKVLKHLPPVVRS